MKKQIGLKKEKAIALFGSKTKLAKGLGVSPSAVTQWPDGELIPNQRYLQIRYELKPEHFA